MIKKWYKLSEHFLFLVCFDKCQFNSNIDLTKMSHEKSEIEGIHVVFHRFKIGDMSLPKNFELQRFSNRERKYRDFFGVAHKLSQKDKQFNLQIQSFFFIYIKTEVLRKANSKEQDSKEKKE